MDKHWGKLVGYFVVVAALTTGVMALPVLFGGEWLPEQVAKEAGSIDGLFYGLVVLSIVIFALVMAIVFYSIVHFRGARGDESDGEPIHGHLQLEVVWTIIPLIIVLVIAGLSYKVMVDNESTAGRGSGKMTVFVRAYSFGWAFRQTKLGEFYDQKQLHDVEVVKDRSPARDLVESGELVLPVNTTVRFQVMSCSLLERSVTTPQPEDEKVVAEGACVRRFGVDRTTDAKRKETLETRNFIPGQEGDVNHAFWVPEARMKIDAVSGLPTWTQWTPSKITKVGDHPQVVCAELCGSNHNAMRSDVCIVDKGTWSWWKGELTPTSSVPCAQLKYLTCLPAEARNTDDERAAMIEKIALLLSKNDKATCSDLEEVA